MQPKRLIKQCTLIALIGPLPCDVTLQVLAVAGTKLAAPYLYSKTLGEGFFMKNGKDAPLLADPLPLKEEEKKPWRQWIRTRDLWIVRPLF